MTGSKATAEVKASVEVRPVRSQVFLVACAVVAGIAVVCGAGLLAFEHDSGWGFLGFAALLLFGGYWAWSKSQSDVDLHEAHPTQLALPDGTSLTTDSRTLRSPDGIQVFTQLCQDLLCRRPLPNPDGLVDSRAQPIPDSKDAALAITNKINSDTQATTNALLDTFGFTEVSSNVTQRIASATDSEPGEFPPQKLNKVFNE